MGCDIHCYIEYKKAKSSNWMDFGGRINPGRNYSMFGAMAGVRVDSIPHIKPRGVPSNLAYASGDDYWIFITDDGGEGFCTVEQAKSYMEYGSVLREPDNPLLHNNVSVPDWHSHSWLNADEFELAIASYLKAVGFQVGALQLKAPAQVEALTTAPNLSLDDRAYFLSSITEYWPILHAMRCFEAQGCESRLVFWFDN